MLCQVCNKKTATIHLTEISDGVHTEMHLCEQCAIEQGVAAKTQISINELLSGLLASQPSDDELFGPSEPDAKCPHCGFTLEQFRRQGVLGCPYDYEVFEKALAPLIEKAHNGATSHYGKAPARTPQQTKKQMELANLRQQLDTAVRTEDYELAAKLRDKINEMEKKE
ncbi:MAG: UvrB/UvrC motif-containing protein [Sedimentisphaerales bacterium]|jgi:protein arginine kinase activator|nr:UvrB/UvrC motif-containing protein [Sedimentisphaerales bacterium]